MEERKILDIQLVDVYSECSAPEILWGLLKDRLNTSCGNISHKDMPEYHEHIEFYAGIPYKYWDLIRSNNKFIGAIYLSYNNEIGLHLFTEFNNKEIKYSVLQYFLSKYKPLYEVKGVRRDCFLVNLGPEDSETKEVLERFNFRHIQNTYALISS